MKILAVDDDDSIRELLTLQLIRHGYEVLTAADGAEAMAKAPLEIGREDKGYPHHHADGEG